MLSAVMTYNYSNYTENPISSAANSEPKEASIHFQVHHQFVIVRNRDGYGDGNIIWQTCSVFQTLFYIDFALLFLPQDCTDSIHDMLTLMEIPSSSIERLKRQISTYFSEVALFCRERNCQDLDINIGLDVKIVEEIGELEAWMMDMVGDGGFSLVPASRYSIEALEIKKFDDIEHDPSSICVICMDEYVKGVDVAWLPCSHSFHSECIVMWLQRTNTCPICRFAMPTEA